MGPTCCTRLMTASACRATPYGASSSERLPFPQLSLPAQPPPSPPSPLHASRDPPCSHHIVSPAWCLVPGLCSCSRCVCCESCPEDLPRSSTPATLSAYTACVSALPSRRAVLVSCCTRGSSSPAAVGRHQQGASTAQLCEASRGVAGVHLSDEGMQHGDLGGRQRHCRLPHHHQRGAFHRCCSDGASSQGRHTRIQFLRCPPAVV